MHEQELKYTDKPWDGSKSRWTPEDLLQCIPTAMARYARSTAKGKTPSKADMHLPYKEPKTHDVNINGISAALGRLDQTQGPSAADKASARTELESQRTKARKALGLDKKKMTELLTPATIFSELSNQFAETLMEHVVSQPSVPHSLGLIEQSQAADQPVVSRPANLDSKAMLEILARNQPSSNASGLQEPGYHSALLNSAGFAQAAEAMMSLGAPGIPLSEGERTELAAQAMAPAKNGKSGVADRDYGALPNYQALGITRPAGDATPEELRYLAGAMKLDGTPLEPSDVYSVGAMLISSDIITQASCYIPPLELARLGVILKTRMIRSDQDHNRQVMSGNFAIVDPMIGEDPDYKLQMDHPLLGVAPLTGLTARLLFMKIKSDPAQMAAVESVMMEKVQNLSIAFGYGGITCALCGEMPVMDPIKNKGNIIGFNIDPASHPELCQMGDAGEWSYDRPVGTIRTPASIEGGFIYRPVRILSATADGAIQIEPQSASQLNLAKGSVFMLNMDGGFFFFFGSYCKFHGRAGQYAPDGRKVMGAFTNMRSMINCAAVDKGADPAAKIVVNPELRY